MKTLSRQILSGILLLSAILISTNAWSTITFSESPSYDGTFIVYWSPGFESSYTLQQRFNSGGMGELR